MSGYPDHFSKHLRLTILRLLQQVPSRRVNASILRDAADDLGICATRDQVDQELTWLAEQQLVANDTMGSLIVATLTSRGEDVALGRVVVPGVQRPSAGA